MRSRLGQGDPAILTRVYVHLVDEQARAVTLVLDRAMRLRGASLPLSA
jgi:hypothetical protein